MSLYTSVGGVKKEIKSVYTGVGGVLKEIKELYSGNAGVREKIFGTSNIKFIALSGANILYSKNGTSWSIYSPDLPSNIQLKYITTHDIGGQNVWVIVGIVETLINTNTSINTFYMTLDESLPALLPYVSISGGTQYLSPTGVKSIDDIGTMLYVSKAGGTSVNSDGAYAYFISPSQDTIKHRITSSLTTTATFTSYGVTANGKFFSVRPVSSGASSKFCDISAPLSTTTPSTSFSQLNAGGLGSIRNLKTGSLTTAPTSSDGKITYYSYYVNSGTSDENYIGGRYAFATGVNTYTYYPGGFKVDSPSSGATLTPFYYPVSGTNRMYILHVNSNGIFYTLKTSESATTGSFYYNALSLTTAAVEITGLAALGFVPLDIIENSSKVVAVGAGGKIAVADAPLTPTSTWTIVPSGTINNIIAVSSID